MKPVKLRSVRFLLCFIAMFLMNFFLDKDSFVMSFLESIIFCLILFGLLLFDNKHIVKSNEEQTSKL